MPIIGIGLRWGAVPATTQGGYATGIPFGWLRFMGAAGGVTPPVVAPPDTHDGGYDWDDIRRRYRQAEEDRDKTDRRRRESERRLRETIESAYNRALRIEPGVARTIEAAIPGRKEAKPLRRSDFRSLARNLDAVRGMLAGIAMRREAERATVGAEALRREAILSALRVEEDDIEAVLLMAIH